MNENWNPIVIDIESTNLLAAMLDYKKFPYRLNQDAKLWCVVLRNVVTNKVVRLVKSEVTKERLRQELKGATHIIGHNGIKFDFITMSLFGVLDYRVGYLNEPDTLFGEEVIIVDTLILSRLSNPDRYKGHSLEVWGEKLNNAKTDFRAACIEGGIIDKNDPPGAEFRVFSDIMVDYCITPENKVLKDDLTWVEAGTLNVGDKILGFDEHSNVGVKGRKYRTSEIQIINYEDRPVYEVKLSSGKTIKTTEEHRWLVANKNHGGISYNWVETKNLRTASSGIYSSKIPRLLEVWEEDMSKDAGWIAGMFDGEGTMTKDRFGLSIAQRPTPTLTKIESILKAKYRGEVSKRDVKSNSDCVSLRLNGCAAQKLEFLGKIRPERMMRSFTFEKMGRVESRLGTDEVISITPVGVQKIIKIQTSTKTFVCEGYPMHNCEQDTNVNKDVFLELIEELGDHNWQRAIKEENKLADQAVRRETFGFDFDKDMAVECVADLTGKMLELSNRVNPILPPKPMGKTEIKEFTPPATQIKKDGTLAAAIQNFAVRIGAEIEKIDDDYWLLFEKQEFLLPYKEPLKTHVKASINNLDHVKMHLISLGWEPSEWRERDLTKDSKKQNLSYEKRVTAMERWVKETFEGKYEAERLEIIKENYKVSGEEEILEFFRKALRDERPVRVPTSPTVRVGVEKELCPSLVKLGEKVDFAKDFSLYLTYKHRKASIAGGDIEDMDFDIDTPNTGYLSMYRDEDGRVATPAIEIGASTSRYRHIGIANIPRATSIYGKEMRSLFGSGKRGLQFGYDFASLEARIMGHYVMNYTNGAELAESMLAEKPNDIHSVNARKLGIPRSDAKSLTYGILYGAQPKKIAKMLRVSLDRAKEIYNEFWEAVPALKELKEKAEQYWESTGKKFILGIDGRKINIRSKHSILNALFQSAGVICAKYVNIFSMQYLEERGYVIDPFLKEPDVCEMIAYHDECQLFIKKSIVKFETFGSKEEAEQFVKDWKGGQLSAISEGNKWYITLPNDVSEAIEHSIRKTEKLLKLNVPLGFEWIVNKTWYGCH